MYAIIGPDNKAINFINWDGETPYDYGASLGNYAVSLENIEKYGFGWEWNGSFFVDPTPPAPVPTFEGLKEKKLADLANVRWQKETGGTTYNSMSLATDSESQTKYVGAVVAAQLSPLISLQWKLADGTFVTLDATAITEIAMAVRAHIQACFDREAQLLAEIETSTNKTELDAIDINVGWPT